MAHSDGNSFEEILDRALANDLLTDLDKREGSVIYDALAPMALELAEAYVKMDIMEANTFFLTATGSNLDMKAYDYGMVRNAATYAERIAEFRKWKTDPDGNYERDADGNKILVAMDVAEGARFAEPDGSCTFRYVGEEDGNKIVRCEQAGSAGNVHVGQILPLTPIAELVEARITSTWETARDRETDDELRARVKQKLNYQAFGGNTYDYIERVNAMSGVGNTKVFPAWRHNGSVLLSVVDSNFNPVTKEFAARVKEAMDPEERTGEGVGTAPIGHFVTVGTPSRLEIDVGMDVTATKSLDALQEEVEDALADYFLSLRRTWRQDGTINVLRAQVINAVINIESVINVRDVTLNGEDDDIIIRDGTDKVTLDDGYTIAEHFLPYLGSVTLE